MRRNFKQLPTRIALLSSVEDGIYVSDLEGTYFMGGGDPGEAILSEKADFPALSFMGIEDGDMHGWGRGAVQESD